MKNIATILEEAGIEISAEKLKEVEKSVLANYKTIAEHSKLSDRYAAEQEKSKNLSQSLEKLQSLEPEKLKTAVDELKKELEAKSAEYAAQLADRDFKSLLSSEIAKAGGVNAKAISALLDIDRLKDSHNQAQDIQSSLAELAKAQDSAMLFKQDSQQKISLGKAGDSSVNNFETKLLKAMGLNQKG